MKSFFLHCSLGLNGKAYSSKPSSTVTSESFPVFLLFALLVPWISLNRCTYYIILQLFVASLPLSASDLDQNNLLKAI